VHWGALALVLVACGDDGIASLEGSTGADGGTTAVETGESQDATEDSAEASSTSGADEPEPGWLPTPSGPCPELVDGNVTFSPAGIEPRPVRLWMSEAARTMAGPLVFYWHGAGSRPEEALVGLDPAFVAEVVDQGGIIAAPHSDPASGQFPWYLTTGTEEHDLLVADEVLACAVESTSIDVRRIHSAGMSAGGLHTAQFSYRRSAYLASVTLYSGGFIAGAPPDQDPQNPLSALVFHGGPSDVVVISFEEASENYLSRLRADDRFGILCDHGQGHTIPPAQASVWRFFAEHPFGTRPSPYAAGLPEGFPDYCVP
jgi:predicted esterase